MIREVKKRISVSSPWPPKVFREKAQVLREKPPEFYLCSASFHFCNTLFLTTGDFAVEEDGIVTRPGSHAGIAHACP
jgi:hypothetical protein